MSVIRTLASMENPLFSQASMSAAAAALSRPASLNHRITRQRTRSDLADLFGPRFVGAIHGRLLTAWSVAGVLGPVLVNYVNEQQVRAGVPRSAAYDRTMILLAGLLAIGFVCNLLVRPVEMVSTEAVGPAAASSSPPASQATETMTRYAERGIGLLVSLWLLVAVPLAWGLWTTLQQAWALFG